MEEKKRNKASSTITINSILYIVITLFLFASCQSNYDFNKTEWDTNVKERYKMSQSIIKSELLIGKTKPEVIEILGDEYHTYGQDRIAYILGFVSLIGVDVDLLDVQFKGGKVITVDQRRS